MKRLVTLVAAFACAVTAAGATFLDTWAAFETTEGPTVSYCKCRTCSLQPVVVLCPGNPALLTQGCVHPTRCCAHYDCVSERATFGTCCAAGTCGFRFNPVTGVPESYCQAIE